MTSIRIFANLVFGVLIAANGALAQEVAKPEKNTFLDDLINNGKGVHSDLLRAYKDQLETDKKPFKGSPETFRADMGDENGNGIRTFDFTYKYAREIPNSPDGPALPPGRRPMHVFYIYLKGSFEIDDNKQYKFLTIRVFTSNEAIEPPNRGNGSSSTAN